MLAVLVLGEQGMEIQPGTDVRSRVYFFGLGADLVEVLCEFGINQSFPEEVPVFPLVPFGRRGGYDSVPSLDIIPVVRVRSRAVPVRMGGGASRGRPRRPSLAHRPQTA